MNGNATGAAQDPVVVLFRSDLRVKDNRALSAAAAAHASILCVFVLDEVSDGIRPVGAARRWWLHHSLKSLAASLKGLGLQLVLRRGACRDIVLGLQAEIGASAVYWNRRYCPAEAVADAAMKSALLERGVRGHDFDGQLIHDPTLLKTSEGGSYKVFGAFRRALENRIEPRDPVDPPELAKAFGGEVASEQLESWQLLPSKPDWAGGLRHWTPGEAGAHTRLDEFIEAQLEDYATGRDFPAREATSRLSPHLVHGEITPFQIVDRLKRLRAPSKADDVRRLRSELAWREFCYHQLFHFPALGERNFNSDFDAFPWQHDRPSMEAWQRGQTGYPIVDAGMRQLWQTGWMHNRVRMVVASFLTKHLRIDWRDGEAWFWDTLVDADPANNPANWQWVAGSGADAAPYFRIFNPTLQGEKFDAAGNYTRRYVPELDALPARFLHRPWAASAAELREAGVKLGDGYPVPLVEHAPARDRALSAYRAMKGTA